MKEALIAAGILVLMILIGMCAEPFGYSALDRAVGEQSPWFMGVAWRDWGTERIILLPIPINLVAGWLRRGWYELRSWGLHDPIDRLVSDAYAQGYAKGRAVALDEALRRIDHQIDHYMRTTYRGSVAKEFAALIRAVLN